MAGGRVKNDVENRTGQAGCVAQDHRNRPVDIATRERHRLVDSRWLRFDRHIRATCARMLDDLFIGGHDHSSGDV